MFGIAAIGLFMASVDQTIVATALSNIQRDLHAPINFSSWTITLYALGQIIIMPIAGRLSDLYGRRQIFLSAIVLFTLASLACGLAWSIYLLVPLRFVQSLGGGTFMPSATGLVSDMFGRERDRALALFTSIFSIGGIAGPALGGVLVEYASWRTIFLVNVPIGLVMLILAVRHIPGNGPVRGSARLDVGGILLLGSALLLVMFGISQLGDGQRAMDVLVPVPLAAGMALLAVFVVYEGRRADPIIPTHLLYGGGFGPISVLNFLFGCVALGVAALLPLYAQLRYGISPASAGSLLAARSVGSVVLAGLSAMLIRRTGVRVPMVCGSILVCASMVLIAHPPMGGLGPYSWLTVTSTFMGIGMGLMLPASNNAVLHLARGHLAAVAGLRGMFRQSGGIVAVSVSTAAMAGSTDAGGVLGQTFLVFGLIMGASIVLIFFIADHRGPL